MPHKSEPPPNKPRLNLQVRIGITIAVVVAMWSGSWVYTSHFIKSTDSTISDQAARGVFGDQFGGINALFTGLAFTGVIISLLLQQKEMRKQAEALQHQQFESGFFHLMALHTALIDQLDWGGFKQRQIFEKFLTTMQIHSIEMDVFQLAKPLGRAEIGALANGGEFKPEYEIKLGSKNFDLLKLNVQTHGRGVLSQYMDENIEQHRTLLESAYIKAHIDSKDALSHYFRTLFHIISYVDNSELISDDEKERYARLISAQLSGLELGLLFYNCLIRSKELDGQIVEFGYPSMFKLVTKYELLKRLNIGVLFHPIHFSIFQSIRNQ